MAHIETDVESLRSHPFTLPAPSLAHMTDYIVYGSAEAVLTSHSAHQSPLACHAGKASMNHGYSFCIFYQGARILCRSVS